MLKHSAGNHFIFPDLLDRFLICRTHGVFLYFYGKINKTVDIICDHIFSIRAVGIPVNFSLKTQNGRKVQCHIIFALDNKHKLYIISAGISSEAVHNSSKKL